MLNIEDLHIDAYVKVENQRIAIVDEIDFENKKITLSFFDNEEIKTVELKSIKELMLTNDNLMIGDKVKLEPVFFKDENSKENPIDCVGEIFEFDGYWLYVNWSNGEQNTYRKIDADLVKQ